MKSEGGERGRREREEREGERKGGGGGKERCTWFSKFKRFLCFNNIITFLLQSSKPSIINSQCRHGSVRTQLTLIKLK